MGCLPFLNIQQCAKKTFPLSTYRNDTKIHKDWKNSFTVSSIIFIFSRELLLKIFCFWSYLHRLDADKLLTTRACTLILPAIHSLCICSKNVQLQSSTLGEWFIQIPNLQAGFSQTVPFHLSYHKGKGKHITKIRECISPMHQEAGELYFEMTLFYLDLLRNDLRFFI